MWIPLLLACLMIGALSLRYFGSFRASILLLLGITGVMSYPWMAAGYFAVVSLDVVRPTVGGLLVAFSEFGLALCLLLLLLRVRRFSELNWKPLMWGIPFFGAICISGIIQIPLYKVVPHLFRSSELMLGCFVGLNALILPVRYGFPGPHCPEKREDEPRNSNPPPSKMSWAHPFLVSIVVSVVIHTSRGFIEFYRGSQPRVGSSFENPNLFAGYLAVLLPVLLMFVFVTAGKKVRIFWFYLLIILSVSLLLTLSRSGLVSAILAGSLVWFLYYADGIREVAKKPVGSLTSFLKRSGRVIGLHLVAAILIAVWAGFHDEVYPKVTAAVHNLEVRLKQDLDEMVFESRFPYWTIGWEMWKDHPLIGVGPGLYIDKVSEYQALMLQLETRVKHKEILRRLARLQVHNAFLQLMVDVGLLGFAGFFFFMFKVCRYFLSRWSSTWSLAGLGVVTAFLVDSFFDIALLSIPIETGLLLGFLMALSGSPVKQKSMPYSRFAGE